MKHYSCDKLCKGEMFQYCMNSTLSTCSKCDFIISTYCKLHFNKDDYLEIQEINSFVDSINCEQCIKEKKYKEEFNAHKKEMGFNKYHLLTTKVIIHKSKNLEDMKKESKIYFKKIME